MLKWRPLLKKNDNEDKSHDRQHLHGNPIVPLAELPSKADFGRDARRVFDAISRIVGATQPIEPQVQAGTVYAARSFHPVGRFVSDEKVPRQQTLDVS